MTVIETQKVSKPEVDRVAKQIIEIAGTLSYDLDSLDVADIYMQVGLELGKIAGHIIKKNAEVLADLKPLEFPR
jgi:hypothetical protein